MIVLQVVSEVYKASGTFQSDIRSKGENFTQDSQACL